MNITPTQRSETSTRTPERSTAALTNDPIRSSTWDHKRDHVSSNWHYTSTPIYAKLADTVFPEGKALSPSEPNLMIEPVSLPPTKKLNLYDYDLAALTKLMKSWGQPAYRAKQVYEWVFKHKVATIAQMTNLPKQLREKLEVETTLTHLEQTAEQYSSDGRTVKRLFKLPDGQLIESVLMEYDDGRRTACISTQAGCAMGCVFCATGQMGFARHLTSGEIVEQAIYFARQLEAENDRLSNIVLMGMGEPLHNYDNTMQAIRTLNDPEGMGIGQRNMTLSTVGLVPQIKRFADEDIHSKLAISLHAATDEERNALLPINRRYPLAEVLDAAKYYVDKTGRRMTFEWALIRGENDTIDQAQKLGSLLHGLLCHVNLIPLNPTGGFDGAPSDPVAVRAFQDELAKYEVTSTVRVRRGIDIQAGCGQLKTSVLRREHTRHKPSN